MANNLQIMKEENEIKRRTTEMKRKEKRREEKEGKVNKHTPSVAKMKVCLVHACSPASPHTYLLSLL